MAENYVFRGAADNVWSDPGDWNDTTTGATPAAAAPGPADSATLPGATSPRVIAGPGQAASLSVLCTYGLTGAYSIGELTVGDGTTASALDVLPGATLSAGSVALSNGLMQADGTGSSITVTGTAGNGANSGLFAFNGGVVRVGALTFTGAGGGSFGNNGQGAQVDSLSSFEVGTTGSAGLGVVTIDPGATVSGAGTIQPNIANNGLIEASGTAGLSLGNVVDTQSGIDTQTGSVTGSGRLQIDTGASLTLAANTNNPISFAGSNAALLIETYSPAQITGLITGFAPSDRISDGFSASG